MEFLAVLLEPYKDWISTSAAAVTYLHQLSGVVVCNSIRKQKSTNGFSVVPFLIGTVISLLVARFGLILNDPTIVKVQLGGFALSIGYLCFFLWYTNNAKDRTSAWTKIGYAGALVAAIYAYTFVENPKNLKARYGLILTVLILCLIGSPLLRLGEIIRTKSTAGLPFPMICTGTLISFLWLLHGIVTRETFSTVLNVVIFSINVFQLSLFVIFPSKSTKSRKDGSPSKSGNDNDKKKKN
ncbi:sugar transporter SWEET1-like [Sitodiplosis mosellana]|uniref:sugar transporter SWEET1-like n=1 Tax=Sitodiplosis mosellana TaxID=263140 RepID=UPI002444DAC9|nr:sugar transporter SWEET1-like [Sitodiplosis mosellana]